MPIKLTCADCGQTFRLKDEMAGRKVRCPDCQSIQVVSTSVDDLPEALGEPAFAFEDDDTREHAKR
jgi:transcription elongation factor Elf1